jgi:hypothetical protein
LQVYTRSSVNPCHGLEKILRGYQLEGRRSASVVVSKLRTNSLLSRAETKEEFYSNIAEKKRKAHA